MTKWQLIALAFPVFTTAMVFLTAFGLKRWLDYRYPPTENGPITTGATTSVEEDLRQAERLIQNAQRKLQQVL